MEHTERVSTLAAKTRYVLWSREKHFLKQVSFKLDVGRRREGIPGIGNSMGQSLIILIKH